LITFILLGILGLLLLIILVRFFSNVKDGDSIVDAFKEACCLVSK